MTTGLDTELEEKDLIFIQNLIKGDKNADPEVQSCKLQYLTSHSMFKLSITSILIIIY